MTSKAVQPNINNSLYAWDEWLSRKLFGLINFRPIFLIIEWLAHGIPWLVGSATCTVIAIQKNWNKSNQINLAILLFGIVIDLVLVGLIKISVQRSRPLYNHDDQVYEAPIADKFSFPSGHTSRAAMLSVLAINLCINNGNQLFVYFIATIFTVCLGLSRIFMGRHYVSDVVAGLFLGIGEGFVALSLPYNWFLHFSNIINYVFYSVI